MVSVCHTWSPYIHMCTCTPTSHTHTHLMLTLHLKKVKISWQRKKTGPRSRTTNPERSGRFGPVFWKELQGWQWVKCETDMSKDVGKPGSPFMQKVQITADSRELLNQMNRNTLRHCAPESKKALIYIQSTLHKPSGTVCVNQGSSTS